MCTHDAPLRGVQDASCRTHRLNVMMLVNLTRAQAGCVQVCDAARPRCDAGRED